MSRSASWIVTVLATLGVGLIFGAVYPGGVRAQLRDPPVGWDMWDPGWTRRDVWRPDRMDRSLRWRLTRHETFMREGVPPAYRGASNPSARTPDTIRAGGALYAANCAACHDPSGLGEGDAGQALYPSPALLAHLLRMPDAVDEYLLWAISEGGEPFGTAMPAFKDTLSTEQIWQIITYMRAGFPPIEQTERQ
jgi:mono/diheme cytochrome c family protein